MMLNKIITLLKPQLKPIELTRRSAITAATGTIAPKPERESFGLIKVCLSVIPGILVGALISRSMANFLEENELFVPSDDEDDDD